VADGLGEMLASYGVEVGEALVLDPQNEPFPVQVQRQVSGMQVIEIQQLDYPPFVDVRTDGMDKGNPIVSNLPAVTLHWASPLTIDEEKNQGREVTVLLKSTTGAWLRTNVDVQPNPTLYPEYGFPVTGTQEARTLAVAIRGSFESFYKGRPSPFQETQPVTATVEPPLGTVEVSPESARLVVIASAEFIDDVILDLSRNLSADRYLNNLQLVQNAVDWSVEDEDLLTIRSRGTYARLLKPLEKGQQSLWEGFNYGLALVALVAVGVVWTLRRRSEQPMELVPVEEAVPAGDPGKQEPEPRAGGSDE
jgi:ABC-2 type transport system permease protein